MLVLGLVYLEQEIHLQGETTIRLAIIGTVLLSIFVHGLSATPGIDLYARGIASLDSGALELTRNDRSVLENVFHTARYTIHARGKLDGGGGQLFGLL